MIDQMNHEQSRRTTMNEDANIRTVYVCCICNHWHNTIEACQKCVESHKDERIGKLITLGSFTDDNLNSYIFSGDCFRLHRGDVIKQDVVPYGIYERPPRFRTECMDNPEEVLKAKHRLLDAAMDWAYQYALKLKEMKTELENEQ